MSTHPNTRRVESRLAVQEIVAASGSSFATGMKLLSRDRRQAMFAIYAFCRLVDDITDGQGTEGEKLAALDHWSDEIARTYQRTPSTAVGEELAHAIERFQLPRREFDLILAGMRMDVEGMVAPHPMRLARYVRCVAGTVGVLSLRVFGAWQGEASRRFALSLASAMQLTNILRDVEEDAFLGRLYIPAPLLAAAGVPPDPHGLAAPNPSRSTALPWAGCKSPVPAGLGSEARPCTGTPHPGTVDDGTLRKTSGQYGGRLGASATPPPRLAEDDRRGCLRG